jgi:Zn-dependent metalloprotease
MKKRSTLLTGLLFTCFQAFSQVLTGEEAAAKFPKAEKVRLDPQTQALQFIRFRPGFSLSKNDFPKWLRETLRQPASAEWKAYETFKDELGFEHVRYQQYQFNIPVEGQTFIAHLKNGVIVSCNGESKQLSGSAPTVAFDGRTAFHKALQLVGAQSYMWQNPAQEQMLKVVTNNSKATFYPTPQLVFAPANGDFDTDAYVPAYKVDIYASAPLQRANIYLSATDGKFLFKENLLHDIDSTANIITKYSGPRTAGTAFGSGLYRLEQSGLGVNIHTFNLARQDDYANAVEFTDADNHWNNVNNFKDEVAGDAHWGAEVTYKYYKNKFNRNSYNNQGAPMLSYVHFDQAFNNAFWNGFCMTYGDGDGSFMRPLLSLDVVGHEFTHGVTGNSARLIYRNESGALNESFSDIFGTAIDFQNNGANANYLIGEQVMFSGAFRSMQNPNLFNNPDTYLGKYWQIWQSNGADNGGVHGNSGVQNFWFYLLVNGGQGVNDLNNAYNVTGIGMDKAERISYRTLTTYLTASSNYQDAAAMSIEAAEDLYGVCAAEVVAVGDAWHAVGIGQPYRIAAAFSAENEFFCTAPATVQFSNKSVKANTYVWDFGDGQTSTAVNPTHTYAAIGDYHVKLKAIANAAVCGTTVDSVMRTAFIRVVSGQSVNAATCTPVLAATPQANMGIKRMTFNTINRESGDALEGNKDYTCNNQTTLIAGNIYEMNLETGPTPMQRGRVWIDYNNDGTFDPATEEAGNFNPFINVSTAVIRTKPNPVLNTPLRMRVAADHTANIDILPCEQLMRGQYEDYGVIFTQQTSKPVPNFKASQTSLAKNFPLSFTDLTNFQPTSWLWSFPGATPSTSTDQNPTNIVYPTDGVYNVKLVAQNAFGKDSLSRSAYITVGNGGITGISKDLQNDASLKVFPNPAQDNVKIRYAFEGKKSISMVLVNALGQEIIRKTTSATNSFEADLNLENVAPGVYFLRFSDGSNVLTRKLLVQKQ